MAARGSCGLPYPVQEVICLDDATGMFQRRGDLGHCPQLSAIARDKDLYHTEVDALPKVRPTGAPATRMAHALGDDVSDRSGESSLGIDLLAKVGYL